MILFVDDEKRDMASYVEELQLSKRKVLFCSRVDEGLKAFEEHRDQLELLILDIMMPPRDQFEDSDTDEGLRTGVTFFDKIREMRADLPVIMFTNVSDQSVAGRFEREKYCRFLRKEEILPYELVDEVEQFLAESKA